MLKHACRLAAAVVCVLALTGCGQGDMNARIDRLDQRIAALERRVDAMGAATTPYSANPGAAARVAPATSMPSSANYEAGAIAVIHAAPPDARTLAEVPPDSVGGFVYTGGPLTLHDLSAQGVRYTGLAGVELQGWFKAADGGRYQFGADLHGTSGGSIVGADCGLEVWLEDRVVGSQQTVLPSSTGPAEQRVSLVVGANLQPGLYKLRLWTVCTSPTARAARITADLLLKAPSDLNLRGFKSDELLHRP